MKRILILLSAAMILCQVQSEAKKKDAQPSELKVMSYNIRVESGNDGTNGWQFRYPATKAMLDDQRPDVFGVQESLDFQVAYIKEYCRDYKYVGVGREDGKKKGEIVPVFWNKKTVKMLKWGTFWLSQTPDVPSKGWDARCVRSTTWALMKDKKTGRKFYFINTHLDHKGKEARKNGLKLIVDKIAEINSEGYPVVLTGDFNIRPDNEALKVLEPKMKCARLVAETTDSHHTYNAWSNKKTNRIIDYIYFSGFSSCPEYKTVTGKYADKPFVSDHYPIYARLIF